MSDRGRTIFVGDIHGCIDELRELLEQLDAAPADRFIFVGDYVDRGPDSIGVLRLVADLLAAHPGSVAVAGNHEAKLISRRERGEIGEPWQPSVPESAWEFVCSLPLVHELPDLNAVVVHGGFNPRFFEHYPVEGLSRIRPNWHRGGGKYMRRARRFLRVRHVNPAGDLVPLGEETADDRHWSEVYNGRAGFAIFGHDPLLARSRRAKHALGLDTGCVFGGTLTAYVVEGDVRQGQFVAVRARQAYATMLTRDHIDDPDA